MAYALPTHQHGCSVAPPHKKKRRVVCRWQDDLDLSHRLLKPANGISTCAFCIIREGGPGVKSQDFRTTEAEADNLAARR
jgi:hypothetical protein